MKVFVSWSGQLSEKIGEVFKDWLPGVLQYVRPYFTPADIEKGSRWSADISKELEHSKIGIFIFTKENLDSQWMMFEAGAISKTLDNAKVCPILFGLDNSDFKGPLLQFQTSQFNKVDIRKLIRAINGSAGDQKLEDKVLDEVFEMWWNKLEQKINKLLEENKVENTALRPDRELVEEILALARITAKNTSMDRRPTQTKHGFEVEKFKALVAAFVASTINVFSQDWDYTKECLDNTNIDVFIAKSGNFLEPKADDETNNWASRGNYLESFRKLKSFMEENKVMNFDNEEHDIYPF